MLLSKTVNELCSFLALFSEMNIRTCTCIYIFFRDPSKQYSHTMEALNEKVLILKAVYEVIPSDLYPMKKCAICASFFTFKLKILTIFKMFNFYFVDFWWRETEWWFIKLYLRGLKRKTHCRKARTWCHRPAFTPWSLCRSAGLLRFQIKLDFCSLKQSLIEDTMTFVRFLTRGLGGSRGPRSSQL